MIYKNNIFKMPQISNFYTVKRNTVWHISDPNNILIVIMNGRCKLTSRGETVEARCGDAYFVPAGVSYLREPVNNELCTMTYIHFSLDCAFENYSITDFSKYINDSILNINRQIFSDKNIDSLSQYDIFINSKTTFKQFKDVVKLLESINLFSSNRALTCSLQSSLALSSILLALYKSLYDSMLSDKFVADLVDISPKIKKALNYISQNYTNTISLDQIADCCNVSKQQVIRYFKTYLKTTPAQYIIDFKIAKAKEFLFNQKDIRIKEIATELGFDDQHYFTRLFKKQTGETPTEFRDRVHRPYVQK